MKKQFLLTAACAGLVFGAAGSSLCAQGSSQMAYASETAAKGGRAPAKKPHKVWTEDNVSSLRTPADNYLEQKEAAAQAAAAASIKEEKTPKRQGPSGPPPALSNPKTTADADRMIAWEERDLEAQLENVDRVRTQLEQAPPEDRERLQKLLVERIQVVEDVKKERDDLLKQKKALEKKTASGANSGQVASASPAQ
jgi:hypothetical protein